MYIKNYKKINPNVVKDASIKVPNLTYDIRENTPHRIYEIFLQPETHRE